MRIPSCLLVSTLFLMSGCSDPSGDSTPAEQPPFVKTAVVKLAPSPTLGLSGTVHAQVETPLSFQVGGRIAARHINAGQQVTAEQVLFELDKQDLNQTVRSASAELAAAKAGLDTSSAELARNMKLLAKQYVSDQVIERSQLARREAQTRLDAAEARLVQARNAQEYGNLKAPVAGVLIEVAAESGQVIAAGQPVATLAQAGDREIEVYFPEHFTPPATGEARLAEGQRIALRLREVAGAVDAQSHTLRARYTLQAPPESLALGTIVQTQFTHKTSGEPGLQVPIGAIDERGQGARVWRLREGRVTAVPVSVLAIDSEQARIQGQLATGDQVVALGTHLLNDNMVVQALPVREASP